MKEQISYLLIFLTSIEIRTCQLQYEHMSRCDKPVIMFMKPQLVILNLKFTELVLLNVTMS